jgi:hypothetical protein
MRRFLCAYGAIIVDERLWIKIGMKINEENEMMNNDERKNVGSIQCSLNFADMLVL